MLERKILIVNNGTSLLLAVWKMRVGENHIPQFVVFCILVAAVVIGC